MIFSLMINILCNLGETRKVSASTFSVNGNSYETDFNFYPEYSSRLFYGAILLSGNSSSASVEIDFINYNGYSYAITEIGANAFSDSANLQNLYINNTNTINFVYRIGSGAFQNCSNLQTVSLKNPQYTCKKQVNNSSEVRMFTIRERAFKNCSRLSTASTLIEGARYINNNAFENCTSLTSLSFYEKAVIGDEAFKGCTGLTSITLPLGITSIGAGVFENCTGLTTATLTNTLTGVSDRMFKGCTHLTSVTIPYGVKTIGDEAFKGCTSLTSVTIPSSVTSIGAGAFDGCTSLRTVTMPSQVTSIGDDAFNGCTSLSTIDMPSSLKTVGNNAFKNCRAISSATFSSALTKIGNSAFEGCTGLTTINFPLASYNNLTTIGSNAIKGCTNLTGDLLEKCKKLTGIGAGAFENCGKITALTISDTVTSIGDGAFKNCALLETVTLPNKITAINENTFYGCDKILKLCIPEGVLSIYNSAFSGCTHLATLYLPKTLVRIETGSFGTSDRAVKVTTVWYGGTAKYRRNHISIAGASDDTYGNGWLDQKSEWIYGQNEAAFNSGHQVLVVPDDSDDEDESGSSNNSGSNGSDGSDSGSSENGTGEQGSFVKEGFIYYDYEFKSKVETGETITVMANAPKKTKTGETGSTIDLYTNITPTYTFLFSNQKVKGKLGKVVAGITTTDEIPYVLGSSKIHDDAAVNIASAKIRNGVITITAKKQPGDVFLHVIDTGDGGAHACIPIKVTALPRTLKVIKDDAAIKSISVKPNETASVYVKSYIVDSSKTETEITGVDIEATLEGKSAGYFKIEKSEIEEGCFIITALRNKNGKSVKGGITFYNPLNGKKVKLKVVIESNGS